MSLNVVRARTYLSCSYAFEALAILSRRTPSTEPKSQNSKRNGKRQAFSPFIAQWPDSRHFLKCKGQISGESFELAAKILPPTTTMRLTENFPCKKANMQPAMLRTPRSSRPTSLWTTWQEAHRQPQDVSKWRCWDPRGHWYFPQHLFYLLVFFLSKIMRRERNLPILLRLLFDLPNSSLTLQTLH